MAGVNRTRVVITGVGTVNAVAGDAQEFALSLREGKRGVGPLTVFDPGGHLCSTAAEVKDLDPVRKVPRPLNLKRASRADAFGMAAAAEALSRAGLWPLPDELKDGMGLSIGGGAGGLLGGEEFFQLYLEKGRDRAPYSLLDPVYSQSTADHLSDSLGLMGPKTTLMTACSSGGTSLGLAADLIRSGRARIMLAGGAEPICRMTYSSFNALRAVDPDYCKPFSKNRRGLSLGEGAGMVVMESLEHARARGAEIWAEFLGYGLSADAHHPTAPDPEGRGAARAMLAALGDAGVPPGQVDYINAHGTATPANDVMETKAIKAALGPDAHRVPISSTKSMTGHTLGAAGSIEAVAVILAMREGFIPPTLTLEEPDPELDLDYVPGISRPARIRTALSNSFAFGGNNTCIVLGAWEG